MLPRLFLLTISTVIGVIACNNQPTLPMNFTEKQLTKASQGHTIHHTQVFSSDGKWVVYDTRNDDTKIGSTGQIEMVNIESGEVRTLYTVPNQTEFGPGVGAATFSPTDNRVMFIHGIRNADKSRPYGMTRRTGVAIDIDNPNIPIFMDARNVARPFTPGALRGGTHAHSWSGDGQWISFTYNDWVIEQLALRDTSFRDLRMVGVMVPSKVKIVGETTQENHSGECFSVIVTQVTVNPEPGSDEIDKAFDECWIGLDGYFKPDGKHQHKAIAFQGDVRNASGRKITEIFVVDLPDNVTIAVPGVLLQGTEKSFPGVPEGVRQRRVTYSESGVEGPRHWLRTTPDGRMILYLARDDQGVIQVFGVPTNGGNTIQFTHNNVDVQGQFNLHPTGQSIIYPADNAIWMTDIESRKTSRITAKFDESEKPVGAPSWSPDGKHIVYTRYVGQGDTRYLQVFRLSGETK